MPLSKNKNSDVQIPVEELNPGIQICLEGSDCFRRIAEMIVATDHEGYQRIPMDPLYALVLFYYAVEELGKAIMLEEGWKKAKEDKSSEVIIEGFKDHYVKIKAAQKKHPELAIEELDPKFIQTSDGPQKISDDVKVMKAGYMTYVGSGKQTISSGGGRSDIWLASFDENKKEWISPPRFNPYVLQEKIERMKEIYMEWQEKYTWHLFNYDSEQSPILCNDCANGEPIPSHIIPCADCGRPALDLTKADFEIIRKK